MAVDQIFRSSEKSKKIRSTDYETFDQLKKHNFDQVNFGQTTPCHFIIKKNIFYLITFQHLGAIQNIKVILPVTLYFNVCLKCLKKGNALAGNLIFIFKKYIFHSQLVVLYLFSQSVHIAVYLFIGRIFTYETVRFLIKKVFKTRSVSNNYYF